MQTDCSFSSSVSVPDLQKPLASEGRIVWLDILRFLCAIEIVGFHWMRAATKTGAFAKHYPQNLIVRYRQLDIGLIEGVHLLQADSSSSAVHRFLVDSFGIAFGFGWEAVFAFVLLSGVSLSLSLGRRQRPPLWPSWIFKRLKRVLLPFYLVAAIVGSFMFLALAISSSSANPAFRGIREKLVENIGSDFAGLIWSHLFLCNPHERYGTAVFLAPAWWFVPAILLAYTMFPLYMRLLNLVRTGAFLAIGALISIATYELLLQEHIQEFGWWFIVSNECFNFFLGIVLGRYLATASGRIRIERTLHSPALIICAVIVFLAGNICNLYAITYPISSLLFTGSLTFVGACFAKWVSKSTSIRNCLRLDPYNLYLVHQPIAFPLMVASESILGPYCILIGFIAYVPTSILVTAIFSGILDRLSASAAEKATH